MKVLTQGTGSIGWWLAFNCLLVLFQHHVHEKESGLHLFQILVSLSVKVLALEEFIIKSTIRAFSMVEGGASKI
jgi:hypothetical protein